MSNEQKKPGVYDADIERLMELAMRNPGEVGCNIVGLGAMWLAAELYGLQERQEALRKSDEENTVCQQQLLEQDEHAPISVDTRPNN